MGRVFTWDEVRLNRIPQIEDFNTVTETLKGRFASVRCIHFAALFGSVVRGDTTRRSDVNCIVIYDIEHEQKSLSLLRSLVKSASRLYVPLAFTPLDSVVAQTRMHPISKSFAAHIERSVQGGGLIKGKLSSVLSIPHSFEESLHSYLKYELAALESGWVQYVRYSEADRVRYLTRLLESPLNAARVVLQARSVVSDDEWPVVLAQYRSCVPRFLSDTLTKLTELDRWYSEELEFFLNERRYLGAYRYMRCLKELESRRQEIVDFLRQNVLLIA